MKETDLGDILISYLRGQSYSVSAEVNNCDLVARKGDETLLFELKTSMSSKLLVQGLERKALCESVYLVLPVPVGRDSIPNQSDYVKLIKALELGLILIHFMKTKTKVEVLVHPQSYSRRRRPNRFKALIREIDGRYGEYNRAGQPSTEERITRFKQDNIQISAALAELGESSPKSLVNIGCSPRTGRILSQNMYGWYQRIGRGLYTLHPAGTEALKNYPNIVKDALKTLDFSLK
jgi:hypothetical protein